MDNATPALFVAWITINKRQKNIQLILHCVMNKI
uniref:Uncharacterized protein n=1 Tax=Anguilla anguilla TaxID=7936 RepID=A0A0E9PTX7_ANGAN